MRIDPDFIPLLSSYDLPKLEVAAGTIVGLWADLRLAYTNPNWERFALANGGAEVLEKYPLGSPITSVIPQVLLPFYIASWEEALATNTVWEHRYLCSSPDVERHMILRVLPLQKRGLLMIHSPVQEASIVEQGCGPDDLERRYRNDNGFIVQCAHCRKVRPARDPHAWDWVPSYVASCPGMASHSICEPCLAFYYRSPMGVAAGEE